MTHVHIQFLAKNGRYYDLPEYLPLLLGHPVYTLHFVVLRRRLFVFTL
jgi:hypothetical protein